jgi:hypothetical protein
MIGLSYIFQKNLFPKVPLGGLYERTNLIFIIAQLLRLCYFPLGPSEVIFLEKMYYLWLGPLAYVHQTNKNN